MQELGADPDIYEKLTASIAPSIWQLDDVKKGILCQLFGGTTKVTALQALNEVITPELLHKTQYDMITTEIICHSLTSGYSRPSCGLDLRQDHVPLYA